MPKQESRVRYRSRRLLVNAVFVLSVALLVIVGTFYSECEFADA